MELSTKQFIMGIIPANYFLWTADFAGAFTKTISGLTPNTSYRVRAYAVNSAGTSYGTTVDVTTLKAFKPRTTWF